MLPEKENEATGEAAPNTINVIHNTLLYALTLHQYKTSVRLILRSDYPAFVHIHSLYRPQWIFGSIKNTTLTKS